MAEKRRNLHSSAYYIDGNTVRRQAPAPDYSQTERIEKERKERLRREKEEELRRKKRAIRRRQERELRMSRSYVAFLTVAVAVFGVYACAYIRIQSDVTARMRKIASLESQIENLRADNDEALKRINTTLDLDGILNEALNEYGMTYAKESQLVYYSVGDEDYMNQYSEIPDK